MKIIVYPVWQLVEKDMMQGVAAVVIDVLRATSSITAGIENGASSIIPVENIETASRIVDPGDRSTKLLAGEWKGHKVEGFDLDNSPLQFSRQNVEKKTVIFTTSNGTHAILAASRAKRVLIASLSNVEAVAAALAEEGDIGIVCAGNGSRWAIPRGSR
jgi:2-phosphosulfolactate phosphatase